MPRKILLTGSRHFVALKEARILHDSGCEVYTADSVNFDYTMYSNAVKKHFLVPSVRFEETKYIEKLCEIIIEYKIDEVVALGEETFYLSNNIQKIRQSCSDVCIKLDSLDKLSTLHNKWLFYKLSMSLKFTVPKTALVKSPSEIAKLQQWSSQHSVIKPIYSRFGYEVKELYDINMTVLESLDWDDEDGYIIQEYIKGEDISSFSMSSDGSDIITYKSALTTSAPGAMAAAIRVETPQQVRDIDIKIRKALNYSGQLGLDFLLTPDGEIVLLEANPRATIGRVLMRQPKIQFRIMMLHQFLNGLIPLRAWLKYFWVMTWYPDMVWSWRDIRPAFMSQIMCKGLGTYLRFLSRHSGVSFQAYSTYDMEYNGDKVIISKVENPTKNDDKTILSLLEGLSRKGMFYLIYTRRPSPLLSFKHEQANIGVIKDSRQDIKYMCACSHDEYYINGKSCGLGYLSAVRKNPTFQGFIDWRMPFFNYFSERNYFFSVMKSNSRAIQAFTRPHESLVLSSLVADYNIMIINARRIAVPHHSKCIFKNTVGINRAELLEFINREGRKYNFFPVVNEYLLQRLDITDKNSFVLLRDGNIVGFAGLVDQRKWKQFIIVRYAWILRFIRIPFNLFARRLSYISIPKQDKTVICPTATIFVVSENDQNLYKELLYGLSCEARKKADIFTLAVTTKSPLYRSLQTRYNFAIENNLYIQEINGLAVDGKQVYVDALMLY
ncbi:MAG: ATP-grasp domain-containing protein [Candidatus Saccharibacteria bacterium]